MKVEGNLEGVPILLLIDSGASHNYITRELVILLNLSISGTRKFVVTLGNGSKRASRGLCEELRVFIRENCLHVNAYILEIGDIDMILEMEWLETLGKVKTNWKRKVMSYQHGDCTITLKGYQAGDNNHVLALQEKSYTRRRRSRRLIKLCRWIWIRLKQKIMKLCYNSIKGFFKNHMGCP